MMRVGGLQRLTTLDFPGVVSAIIFTQGCNFCCPYCHNPNLVPGRANVDYSHDILFEFLKKRQGLLGGIVISGGEPTIQPGLADFCLEIKKLKYKVKVDSNGSNPHVLQNLIYADAVDYIALDLKTAPALYNKITGVQNMPEKLLQSIAVIKGTGIAHEFRTTCAEPFANEEILRELALRAGDSPWFLQTARIDRKVLNPAYAMRGMSRPQLEALLPELQDIAPRAALRE